MPDTPVSLAMLSNDLADLVDHAGQSVVALEGARRRPLSGLHWRQDLIVTAEEALERDEKITVLAADGRRAEATLIGRDPTTDLAVLRFAADALPVIEVGDAASLRTGHFVLAVGRNRLGPVAGLGIAAIASNAWHSRRGGRIDRLIHLDVRFGPTTEGGALADMSGRVLGMTVAGPRRRVLAIPSSTIDRVVDQLLEKGYVARGYLGAGLMPVRHGGSGVLLISLDPDGPASRAGLLVGDIITALNGQTVTRMRDIMRILGPDSVGSTVDLTLVRGGVPVGKSLVIGERRRQ